jgi:sigma-B regulation protein RsbU (phosphoserine phosphatase)
MERHNELFCTVWYGVYHRGSGRLRYASAGHPPAMLVSGTREAPGECRALKASGPCVGLSPAARYGDEQCVLRSPARLYVFSDGTYEITRPDGAMLAFSEFTEMISSPVPGEQSELDRLLEFARETHGPGALEDDFTIIEMTL